MISKAWLGTLYVSSQQMDRA